MARKNSYIELPREPVADLFETSQKFHQLLETLEVELDPAKTKDRGEGIPDGQVQDRFEG